MHRKEGSFSWGRRWSLYKAVCPTAWGSYDSGIWEPTIGKAVTRDEGAKRYPASKAWKGHLQYPPFPLSRGYRSAFVKLSSEKSQWLGPWRHFLPPSASDRPPLDLQSRLPIMLHIPRPPENPLIVSQSLVFSPNMVARSDHWAGSRVNYADPTPERFQGIQLVLLRLIQQADKARMGKAY